MPTISRWMIRTALAHLVLGSLLGAAIVARSLVPRAAPTLAALTPAYFHLLLLGWVTQLIFGVAWWLFPRAAGGMSASPVWIVYACLNLGLVLRTLAEPLTTCAPGPHWTAVLTVSALLLWAAVAGFALAIWPRVRG